MEFFLNEWSLQAQFVDDYEFSEAAVTIAALVLRAREISRGRSMLYRSERIDHRCAVGADPFQKSIHSLNREVKEALLDVVYNKSAPAPWETMRRSDPNDSYHWLRPTPAPAVQPESAALDGAAQQVSSVGDSGKQSPQEAGPDNALQDSPVNGAEDQPTQTDDPNVSDTSIAELAERLMCAAIPAGCLLNFVGSDLAGSDSLDIVKNRATPPTAVASFETVSAFDQWLGKFPGAIPYNPATATEAPRDEQTCLVDATRFELTTRPRQNGRALYEERTTRDIYYVDSGHWGRDAHLEVFTRMGQHKGEATLDGKPIENTRVKNRTIDD